MEERIVRKGRDGRSERRKRGKMGKKWRIKAIGGKGSGKGEQKGCGRMER